MSGILLDARNKGIVFSTKSCPSPRAVSDDEAQTKKSRDSTVTNIRTRVRLSWSQQEKKGASRQTCHAPKFEQNTNWLYALFGISNFYHRSLVSPIYVPCPNFRWTRDKSFPVSLLVYVGSFQIVCNGRPRYGNDLREHAHVRGLPIGEAFSSEVCHALQVSSR